MNDESIDKTTYRPCPKCGEPLDVICWGTGSFTYECRNNKCTDSGKFDGGTEKGYGWKIHPDGTKEFKEPEDRWEYRIELFRQFCEAHEDFTDDQIREFLEDMAIAIVTEALRDGD